MDRWVKLNNVLSSDHGITVTGIRRRLLPQRTARETPIPGKPGTVEYAEPDIGKTEIAVDCVVEAEDALNLRERARAIALWLMSATTIIIDTEPGIQWTGRVLNTVDIEEIVVLGRFSFIFSAQPYGEATVETVNVIGVETDYGSPVEFFPIIALTLTEAVENLQVTLLSTGEFVLVMGAFAAGDGITIDMATGKVERNGQLIMSQVSMDSDWFAVPPGLQTIALMPSTGVTAQIIYRKRYP